MKPEEQKRLDAVADVVLNYRPKSKMKKPRKRKKAKKIRRRDAAKIQKKKEEENAYS